MIKLFIAVLLTFAASTSAFAECQPSPECREFLNDPTAWSAENQGNGGSLDIADIASNSVSTSCIAWKPVGVCFWLKISLFNVQVRTSLKVRHYIPDLVISAYQVKGENTWSEMSWTDDISDSLTGSFGLKLDGGEVTNKDQSTDSGSTLKFKHATAIGNPLASVWGQSSMDYVMCKAGTTSFMPYFNSIADNMLWRTALPEHLIYALNIWTPGRSIIGERDEGQEYLFSNKWAGLYPRTGFVNHYDDYKAAAVVAARVGSIVTSDTMTHIRYSANASSSDGYWPAGELKEWDSDTGYWQMLYPKMESSCHLFGHIETQSGMGSDGYADRRDDGGNYAWNLWRPYSCCRKEGQVFLGFVGE